MMWWYHRRIVSLYKRLVTADPDVFSVYLRCMSFTDKIDGGRYQVWQHGGPAVAGSSGGDRILGFGRTAGSALRMATRTVKGGYTPVVAIENAANGG